nr:OmpA family protein [Bacteroidota bacterium]
MSADGKILFFTACDRPDGKGRCDIYFARKTLNSWSTPRNIGEPINTSAWETQPSFSADGKSLYFIRGVFDSNGKRQQDIYVSTLGDDGKFQQPTKLSNVINTDKSEESVFIHPDNRTLYFSSNGHIGMGGLDIYMSKKNDDGTWQTPVNLGYPINTSKDENSLMVSPDGMLGYFASDRVGGAGGLDMYEFPLPAAVKPLQLTYVKCNITDAETKLPLPARYEIVNAANGKIVKWANADKTDGSFLTPLSSGVNYSLNITHPGYLFYSDSFECAANANYEHPYILKVELQPLKTGASIVLKNVFFDTDKAELKTESHYELQKLITLLKENAALKIEVSGHTDNTGKKESNMALSQNRAKSVMDYLTQNGIDDARLTAKGYGDTTPCADNATDAGKALNRRTEIKIVK